MASALDLIETIVVVIMENRSFDHMLGYLNLPGDSRIALEGLRDDPEWLDKHANRGIRPYAISSGQKIDDPPHEQATIAIQIGTPPAPGEDCPMNGFVESYLKRHPLPADNRLVMGYYTADSVPTFDFFAREYTLCDHWFAALPTGTQANRLMAMGGATSIVDNASLFLPDQPLVYDWLCDHKVTWCAYQSGNYLPFFTLMPRWQNEIATSLALDALVPHAHPRFRRLSSLQRDWRTGQVPSVIFIEPEYTDGPHGVPNDDHPPTGVGAGQMLLAEVYNTLIANPARWAKTALIVTYDEHGGFYDHVSPLNIATSLIGHGTTPLFTTTGVRVPGFVISPLVENRVYSEPLDHTSILQFLADKFGNGLYSTEVAARQPSLSPLADVFTRTVPREDAPAAPTIAPAAPPIAAAGAPPGTVGANANAGAFDLAAAKIVADHPGIAVGWPEIAASVAV